MTFLKRAVSNNSDHETLSFEFNISFGSFSSLSVVPKFFCLLLRLNSEHFSQMAAEEHFAAAVCTEQTNDTMNNALQKARKKNWA